MCAYTTCYSAVASDVFIPCYIELCRFIHCLLSLNIVCKHVKMVLLHSLHFVSHRVSGSKTSHYPHNCVCTMDMKVNHVMNLLPLCFHYVGFQMVNNFRELGEE